MKEFQLDVNDYDDVLGAVLNTGKRCASANSATRPALARKNVSPDTSTASGRVDGSAANA